jgi:DNA-directed RNA polymerase specialized sigma subunit
MENINLLRKIVWSFHQTYGLDWDDLFQEAYLAYVYALEKYDPKKGTYISTFVWIHVSNQLKTYYQKQKKFYDPLVDVKELQNKIEKPDYFFESLTEDAQEIADLVLATTKKFVELNRRQACKRVTNIMLTRGWDRDRIYYGLLALKKACSNT